MHTALIDIETHDTLEAELLNLASRVAASRCRWLQLLGRFNRGKQWRRLGFRSCAHWLRARMGLSRRAADEQLRIARALEDLPLLTDRFSAGTISYAKVRAITRVATVADESTWLDLAATHTAGQLEAAARLHRRSDNDDPPTATPSELHWHWDASGNLRIRGTLSAEQGALLVTELEKTMTGTVTNPATPRPEKTSASAGTRRANALLTLVQRAHRLAQPRRHRNKRGPGAHPRPGPRRSTHEAWPQVRTHQSHRATDDAGPGPSSPQPMTMRSAGVDPPGTYIPEPRSAPFSPIVDRDDPIS
jgi:hypothetical protein